MLEPLNQSGDKEGARWSAGRRAHAQGIQGRLRAVRVGRLAGARRGPADFGGQAVPNVLGSAVRELMGSANLSFKLCPMLTIGAVEALNLCGSAGAESSAICRRW